MKKYFIGSILVIMLVILVGCTDVENVVNNKNEISQSGDEISKNVEMKNKIKLGEYRISFNINYPTEESKEEIGMYYDNLGIEVLENNEFRLIFVEGTSLLGTYEIEKDKLICKSNKIHLFNHEVGDVEDVILTEFIFKILDEENIELVEINNPDYTYGNFIDTVNVPGNIYTFKEQSDVEKTVELGFTNEEIIKLLGLDFTDRKVESAGRIVINEDGTEVSFVYDDFSKNEKKFEITGFQGKVKSTRYIMQGQLVFAGDLYILNTDGELFRATSDIEIDTDEDFPNKFIAREINLDKKANAISNAGVNQNNLIIKYEDGTFSDNEWIKKEIVDSLLLGNYRMSGAKIQEKDCELNDAFENIASITEFSIGSSENDNIGSLYISGIDSQGRNYKYNCYEGLSVDYTDNKITGEFDWDDYYSDKKYEGEFDEINYIEYKIEPTTNNVTLKIVFKEDSKQIDFEKNI